MLGVDMSLKNGVCLGKQGWHPTVLRVVIIVCVATLLAVSLTACERPGRPFGTNEDYVGIWACYDIRTGKDYKNLELGKGYNQYIVIYKDGRAYEVAMMDGKDPIAQESHWYRTREDRQTGEDSGIVLVNDTYENPYVYYDAGEDTHFVDERLVKGNFAIDVDDNTTLHFEKVSNDPDDPTWLPNEIGVINAKGPKNTKGSTVPEGAIDWTEAKSHIGETVTVYGPVKDYSFLTESNGQPCYIDIGAAYPDDSRVSMVVWGEDRGNFPDAPETMYQGKTVCVTGELYAYDNATYVKVSTPDQVKVLD